MNAFEQFSGFLWLLLTLGPLVFLQRSLHRETQLVFLLLTRRGEIAMLLFSLLFFPGVLLHEISHYLVALLLRVPILRFSLLPRDTQDGRLQLGFVETGRADLLREALIGAAPLLFGGSFVAYAASYQLGLTALWGPLIGADFSGLMTALLALPGRPDFWLWLYLTVAVSSTMLPSASDRRAWLPLGLALALLLGLALLVGWGPWMLVNLAPAFDTALRAVALVFGVGAIVHFALLVPMWGLRRALSNVTGLRIAAG